METGRSEYEDEEKDEVMPLEGGMMSNNGLTKNKSQIVIKEEPELFSRLTMKDDSNSI